MTLALFRGTGLAGGAAAAGLCAGAAAERTAAGGPDMNIVCGPEGQGAAVLIRAIKPLEG